VALVLQLLAFRSRSLFQIGRAPSTDDSLSVFLAATKTEPPNKSWIVVIHGGECDESVLRVELFDLPQRLSLESFRGWKIAQRLAQKILHRRFTVELVNIAAIPVIAGSIEVRHVRQKNCFPGQKRAYRRARNLLGKSPVVPTGECGDGEPDE
jgi:hypothetical protein